MEGLEEMKKEEVGSGGRTRPAPAHFARPPALKTLPFWMQPPQHNHKPQAIIQKGQAETETSISSGITTSTGFASITRVEKSLIAEEMERDMRGETVSGTPQPLGNFQDFGVKLEEEVPEPPESPIMSSISTNTTASSSPKAETEKGGGEGKKDGESLEAPDVQEEKRGFLFLRRPYPFSLYGGSGKKKEAVEEPEPPTFTLDPIIAPVSYPQKAEEKGKNQGSAGPKQEAKKPIEGKEKFLWPRELFADLVTDRQIQKVAHLEESGLRSVVLALLDDKDIYALITEKHQDLLARLKQAIGLPPP